MTLAQPFCALWLLFSMFSTFHSLCSLRLKKKKKDLWLPHHFFVKDRVSIIYFSLWLRQCAYEIVYIIYSLQLHDPFIFASLRIFTNSAPSLKPALSSRKSMTSVSRASSFFFPVLTSNVTKIPSFNTMN